MVNENDERDLEDLVAEIIKVLAIGVILVTGSWGVLVAAASLVE